ncbi:hypothetical protein [Rhodococcoides trifolii]|uniref:hypothetical protein n=1 Tax=Rhodococcoides trifolii TaxID=908250 RepID=UPI0016686C06|nr:hypothetical protein [Rhodococcus trifolii]
MRWSSVFKIVGLAGAVGVAASGALAVRSERQRRAYSPDDVREQLHRRLAVATSETEPESVPAVKPGRLARLRRRARAR